MNFSALTRSILIGSALVAASYAADAQVRQPTVFMLQFGSFETKDEAQDKIKSIGVKHGAMLAKYPPVIREIVMPPDNLTVYRTQAGPVNTRDTAQTVCAQLASQGDECYVVETAMAIPGAAPAIQQAGIIPTESKPTPTRDPANLRALEKVSAPVTQESSRAMNDALDVAASTSAPIAQTASRISSDAQLAGATQTPEAATEQNDESFWSWLTGDEEDENADWEKAKAEKARQAVVEQAQRRAAPVEPVVTEEMTPPAPMAQDAAPVDIVAPDTQAFAPPAPVMAPESAQPVEQALAPMPQEPADAYLGSQGIKLPPPPPPSNIRPPQDMPVMASAAPIEAAPTGPAPVLAPLAPEPTGSIMTTNLPPVPFKRGASVPEGGGEEITVSDGPVQVGEAQRVPLTESEQSTPMEQLPAKVIGVNEEPEEIANVPPPPITTPVTPPSSVAPQKTLWAHIHYFPDQQAALGFWDQYRKAHPDFPVVRVRTTSSLVAQQSGDLRVALRIGPFAQQGFVNILCNSVEETNPGLTCGAITDIGASSNAYAPRNRYAQAAAHSARYANKVAEISEGFWVQLGSYPSLGEAELAWDDAITRHASILNGMKPAIISPEQGSQSYQVFRLRTGPFTDQMAAKDVCSRMKVNSGACLVVSN